eukprot:TRINITY_DN78991_c0_g1_i1.p1 TRINITY_DN78991_c0_g1~~TRINITY_DN78991_c0_g1_i1.p1  ORF type:complete len:547 (+),score=93.12 TRINITY_DN78991_c0_g1_i1:229-1869(+)
MKFFPLLFGCLLSHAWAISKLHVASSGGSTSSVKALSIISSNELAEAQAVIGAQADEQLDLVVEYDIVLKKDIVVFNELQEVGVRISSCSRDAESKQAAIEMRGDNLDASDFRQGVAFVINSEDWEKSCGPVAPVEGIDSEDDALFYEIGQMSQNGQSVSIQMVIISGEYVIPEIDLTFMDKPSSLSSLPAEVVYDSSPAFAEVSSMLSTSFTARMLDQNNTLLTVERPLFTGKGTKTVFPGGVLDYDVSLDAKLGKLKIQRKGLSLRLELMPRVDLDVSFDLSVTKEAKFSTRKELLRKAIPKLGICKKLLGLKICVGAFWKIEWVFDGEMDVTDLMIGVDVEHHSAYILNLSGKKGFEATSKLPPAAGSSGRFTLDFPPSTTAIQGVKAFTGVRPAVGLAGKIGKSGLEGNVGAKLGLEASAQLKRDPAHSPYTGSGATVGTCDRCHILQGDVKIRGKDLSLEFLKNEELKKEKVLLSQLFDIRLSKVCAIPAVCSSDGGFGIGNVGGNPGNVVAVGESVGAMASIGGVAGGGLGGGTDGLAAI